MQSTTEIGGAETVLLNVLKSSQELRDRSVVATLGFGNGNLPDQLRDAGAKVVTLSVPRLRHPWKLGPAIRQFRRVVLDAGVRAIIGNGAHPSAIAGLMARFTGTRSVFLVHQIVDWPPWKNDPRLVAALLAPCDLLVAVSRAVEESVVRLRPRTAHALVYNGTPVREVDAGEVGRARSELGAGSGDVLIGVFGRLQRSKGHDVLIEAFARVARTRSRLRLAIVGGSVFGLEPEFAAEQRTLVERLGISDNVVFTGFRTDVPRLMAACDIVCNPSRSPESFGMAIVEAMMLGRPVIASSGGGANEIITSNDHGVLVPPGDVDSLARELARLIEDPGRRRQIGQSAAARARARFSSDAMAADLVRHLDHLLAGRAAG